MTLIEPTAELQQTFTAMVKEWVDQEGTSRWEEALNDFPAFVSGLRDEAVPAKVKPGWLPCQHYWLITPDLRVIGTSRLFPQINPRLEREGGHIGYTIRPNDRQKGYGTRLLALTLQKARDVGLARVLITCDEDNLGSRRVIEKNGGELASTAISEHTGKPILRYWIDLR